MSVITGQKEARDTRFKRGQSGNPQGRPKGSRHKLSEAFLSALCADFHEHGAAVIQRVRKERPADYLKVIAGLLSRDVNIGTNNALQKLGDDELAAMVDLLRRQLEADEKAHADEATTH